MAEHAHRAAGSLPYGALKRLELARALASALLPAALLLATPARAQRPDQTVQTVAGPQYRAGGFRETFLGESYRPLWTATAGEGAQ